MSTDPRENHIDYVEFPVPASREFGAVKQFYRQAFGWSFQDWGDRYSDTKDSGISSGFTASEQDRAAVPVVVMFTTDLEATRTRVIEAGGTIVREIFSFPGGRRFQFVDPAGNQLGVWSDK